MITLKGILNDNSRASSRQMMSRQSKGEKANGS